MRPDDETQRSTPTTNPDGVNSGPNVNRDAAVRGSKRPTFMMQYRGRDSDGFASKLRTFGVSTIFTTRKLRSCLPSLKGNFSETLKSRVVYSITCPGCESCYVGQTTRHLSTRLKEHLRKSSPLGTHFAECGVDVKTVKAKVIDSCLNINKLLTLEALHIADKRPSLNTREEYRQRHLTLKI